MRIPTPSDIAGVVTGGIDALESAVALVPRVAAAVSQTGRLLARLETLIGDAERLLTRATAIAERTDALLSRLGPALDGYPELLRTLQPMLLRLADTTSDAEVDAAIQVIDMLPGIADKLDADILPVLDTLSTVAPDLRDLLDIARELSEVIGSVPGLGRAKRRIEELPVSPAEYRAVEEPAAAPERRDSGAHQ